MQDPLLRFSMEYLKYRTKPPRVVPLLLKLGSLPGLALLGAVGTIALIAVQYPTPGVTLFIGICIGAAARDLGLAIRQKRYWPVLSQLLDWNKVEEIVGKSKEKALTQHTSG
jgi:hypothetical protein